MTGLRELFDFSRAEIFALALLLLLALTGGGILFYRYTTESIPPELIFQSFAIDEKKEVKAAEPKTREVERHDKPYRQFHSKDLRVNVNTAPAESLMMVSGLGAALARRIIEFRESKGRIDSIGQLIEVRGIGSRNLKLLRPSLFVDSTK